MTYPASKLVERPIRRLPAVFDRYRSDISIGLKNRLTREDVAVFDMLRFHMGWVDLNGRPWEATEGKALRATLCLLACEATGGPPRRALSVAIALELIHNFSLIHDDIQDGDETRHQRATLWAQWGMPKALVAGNTLRVIADVALNSLIEEDVSADVALSVTQALTEAYLEMIEGQYLDLVYEGRSNICLPDYLNMIARKTGALIRCSLTLGALLGTRDESAVRAFRDCGRALGYVFQIRDDVLGVWGDEEATGKPVGADIRRKKNSFPMVYAMSEATGDDKRLLLDVYGKDQVDDDDVDAVLNIMDRVRAKEYARELAAEHRDRAMEAVASVELAPHARRDLEELSDFLLARDY